MIRLFTSAFTSPAGRRRDEYAEALRRNLECAALDEVMVLEEASANLASHPKLKVRRTTQRPTFAHFFSWANEVSRDTDTSIIANADIFFDGTLEVFNNWSLPPRVAFALSRWEYRDGHDTALNDRNDSQDAWCFSGKIRTVDANFEVGVPRCDNRLVSELRKSGYTVLNPSLALRSYHLHRGARDGYGHGMLPGYVSPPYEYVWPENLWPLHKTLAYNFRHPREKLGWRLDRRQLSSRLKLHWISKGLGVLQRQPK